MIYLVCVFFLQEYKESPVTSHRPPISVSSCPLLRVHTISQSLTVAAEAHQNRLSVYSSAQLVVALFFRLKRGTFATVTIADHAYKCLTSLQRDMVANKIPRIVIQGKANSQFVVRQSIK